VLAGARVCTSLEAATRDCRLVIGASARTRSLPCPVIAPAECASRACAESARGAVAVVFGCEQSGLSNEEIDRCQFLVRIPTSPVYGSLNLAAAVQIIAYEIRVAHERDGDAAAPDHLPVSAGEMERFYAHLEETLVGLGFLDPDNPRQLMRRLRRLYNRARPDENEINILRGILAAAQQATGQRG
jgi:TrmH family RNA methyltransferase